MKSIVTTNAKGTTRADNNEINYEHLSIRQKLIINIIYLCPGIKSDKNKNPSIPKNISTDNSIYDINMQCCINP